MGQGGAALKSIQEERWGVGRGIEESGVDGVVGRCEEGEAGSPQWGRAVHRAGVVLCQPPLR